MRGKQRLVAQLVLNDLKEKFGRIGGTWFATETFDPVVAGWWDDPRQARERESAIAGGMDEAEAWRRFPLEEDRHMLVSVDVEGSPTSEESARCTLIDCFTRRYRGRLLAQKTVYVVRQSVLVTELPGRKRAS